MPVLTPVYQEYGAHNINRAVTQVVSLCIIARLVCRSCCTEVSHVVGLEGRTKGSSFFYVRIDDVDTCLN